MQKIVMTSEDLSYCLKHRAFLKQFRIEVETTSLDIKELIKTVSGGALHTSGDKEVDISGYCKCAPAPYSS